MKTEYLYYILAYLSGTIPFGLLIGKMYGIDIRTAGSGNIGATNVKRLIGKTPAIITFLLDGLKGFIPVVIAKISGLDENCILIIGFCAILGHIFPVWLKFKGGKGVSTAIVTYFATSPLLGLSISITWVVVFKISKISSLSAILAFIFAPIYAYLIGNFNLFIFSIFVSSLILIRHKENIHRLLNNAENKV